MVASDRRGRTLIKVGNYVDVPFHMLLQEKVQDSSSHLRWHVA